MTDYGHVMNYQTGESIRPATREDWLRARRDGEQQTGAHRSDEFGDRTIYCDGPNVDPEATHISLDDRVTLCGHPVDDLRWLRHGAKGTITSAGFCGECRAASRVSTAGRP